jgi:hypothetical protein
MQQDAVAETMRHTVHVNVVAVITHKYSRVWNSDFCMGRNGFNAGQCVDSKQICRTGISVIKHV